MEDQVLQLQRRGIAAACSAGLDQPGVGRQWLHCGIQASGAEAPERLRRGDQRMLETHAAEGRLVALAVDEALHQRLGPISGLTTAASV